MDNFNNLDNNKIIPSNTLNSVDSKLKLSNIQNNLEEKELENIKLDIFNFPKESYLIDNDKNIVNDNDIEKNIVYKRSYCVNDFKKDYNSYGGNAYGLANTLMQTAFLRPKLQSKKVKKLYFSGQLSVPGPGVPPAIVSGKLVSDIILKNERAI